MNITSTKYHIYLYIICALTSCIKNENTTPAIKSSDSIRTQTNLIPIDANCKLDSTRRMTPNTYKQISFDDWREIPQEFAKYINDQKLPSKYYLEEHYSCKDSNLKKIVWFKVQEEGIEIAQERGYYLLKKDSNYFCFLIKICKYDANIIEHRIDSIPTKEFIARDKMLINEAYQRGKLRHLDVCIENGQILDYPTQKTIISKTLFDEYRTKIVE